MLREEAAKTLGVELNASEEDIKKAFKKKAVQLHPDVNKEPDAEEKFKKLNEAFRILTGAERSSDQINMGFSGMNINDFFSTIFNVNPFTNNPINGFRRQQNQQNFNPVHVKLSKSVSFETSVLGSQEEISINRGVYCEKCEGTGFSGQKTTCKTCNGEGSVHHVTRNLMMSQILTETCRTCNGSGIYGNICDNCQGNKHLQKTEKVKIKIPPVGDKPITLCIKGKGNTYKINGNEVVTDVYLTVIPTATDGNFVIEGYNVRSIVEIPLNVLLFGGEVLIDVVGGEKQKIVIPKNSRAGQQVSINDYGVRAAGTRPNGRHIVELDILYPTSLNNNLKTALENSYK